MHCSAQLQFPNNPYVLNIECISQHSIVACLSDGSVQLVPSPDHWNQGYLDSYTYAINPNATLTGLKQVEDNVIGVSGSEGVVFFDLRTKNRPVAQFKNTFNNGELLCLDTNQSDLAVGTELVGVDAGVIVWDIRSQRTRSVYLDCHNDDVTTISFHPSMNNVLLSGSTDGLMNIFDTTVSDEDDAVYQTINHGSSINHAGFLSEARFFGLSHMEMLSVYQLADPDETVEEPKPHELGDLRDAFHVEYVTDILVDKFSPISYIACGSNNDKHKFKLIPMENEIPASKKDWISLKGAHGEEVVRTVKISGNVIYTGGEDGVLKAWT